MDLGTGKDWSTIHWDSDYTVYSDNVQCCRTSQLVLINNRQAFLMLF